MASRTKTPKTYRGLDKYRFIRRTKRTYKTNKPKFFLYLFLFFLFLFVCYVSYKKIQYDKMIAAKYSHQQEASPANQSQSYVNIYDFKPAPLVFNQTADLKKEAPAVERPRPPQIQRAEQIYSIEPPNIEGLVLGQDLTEAQALQKQFKTTAKLKPDAFMSQRENQRYSLYGQNALLMLKVDKNKLLELTFTFEQVDTAQLTQTILKAHGIDSSKILCTPTKVLNEEKLKNEKKQEFINTDICQLQAQGVKSNFQVVSLPQLRKTLVSFQAK